MESRPLAAVVAQVREGQATAVAGTWAFEVAGNPDPYILESHPYDLDAGPDGMTYAVSISIDFNDAGDAYVTLNGVGAPGRGQFVRYDALP
jgi:hypothetical protein